uniref:G-protein coupled receptors family 1 profile domain-containing protein n=1 Tax=Anguilla anguilla TaxID=7936 RepID=A0A0E9PNI2_ANGAN
MILLTLITILCARLRRQSLYEIVLTVVLCTLPIT